MFFYSDPTISDAACFSAEQFTKCSGLWCTAGVRFGIPVNTLVVGLEGDQLVSVVLTSQTLETIEGWVG